MPLNDNEAPQIGAPKPVKMDARTAITNMSTGFLRSMEFLANHGLPKDLLAEAMRIGQAYGLCQRHDGFNLAAGVREIKYVNPYLELWKDAPPPPAPTEENN